ncbi:hypothetical protein OSB04_014923 [Centaurea solstitialis]|uniref:DUF674 family protein n=1 Tax=Centaurea solstitialis TaxID=347529 RepID=A0AA38T5T4_9ASTR|nr:hypothetical protein OSB04_014923 [Centaurea solstitialis]
MASTMATEANVSIKVLVDTEKDRVVYAIADHNFVDVLFSFMTFPIGAIIRLLGGKYDENFDVFGSLNNLSQSLNNLPVKYLFSEESKMMLLNPISSAYEHCRKLKLNIDDTVLTKYFICNEWECNRLSFKLSACNSTRCINCGKLMNREVGFKYENETSRADDNGDSNGVFVSDISTFIVTDDLCVMPYTPGCCIQLLRDAGVTDMSFLEERSVDIGQEQILELLRFALSCGSPLTYLVLRKTREDLVKLNHSTSIKMEVPSSDPKMFLQVSLQKSTGKLLFAEAEEDFVDFVFGFLAISFGALIGEGRRTSLNDPRVNGELFKHSEMYMVTDDLVITPCSFVSTMDILKKLKVPLNDIEKHKVSVGLEEPSDLDLGSRFMASTTANEANVTIKVLVDTEKDRVVYAIADHNFVDVLFSFMTLPIAAIIRLLGEQKDDEKFEVFGSLNNLFQVLNNLPVKYLCSEECKIMLLNPLSSAYDHCRKLKLNIDETVLTKYFICNNWNCQSACKLAACDSARCMYCGKLMNVEIRFMKRETSSVDDNSVSGGVFVSDVTTFIVTDDLCVMPYTPGCCIQLLSDVGVTDTSFLEERSVDIGREQILDLLRFALSFSSPLSYLVLHKTHPFPGLVHLGQSKHVQSTSIKKGVSSSDPKMFLHVSLQKSTGKLLFAEAEEDFVDFVFGFLAISLGALIGKLMNGSSSFVCMDNLYRSISTLSAARYLTSQAVKDILLAPHFGYTHKTKNHFFPLKGDDYCPIDMVLPANVTHNWWDSCFLSFKGEGRRTALNNPKVNGELFKHSGMFMVTDDLVIIPCSSVSTMEVLKMLKVPLNDIEKHKVSIGLEEGLRMLKASMRSSSVLSIGLEHQLKKLNPNF